MKATKIFVLALVAMVCSSFTQELSLTSFAGFYRLPHQKAYFQFYVKGDQLVAKQLWDKKEFPLVRKSALEFATADGTYEGKFTVDKGAVTGMQIKNAAMLTKVDYDPEKTVNISGAQLKRLEGRYQLQRDPKFFMELKTDQGHLVLKQLWDNKEIPFVAFSETDFFNKELNFPIHVTLVNGAVSQVDCFATDVWKKAK